MILATYPSQAVPGQELRLLYEHGSYAIERRGSVGAISGRRWRLETKPLKHWWTAREHYQHALKFGTVLQPFPERELVAS